MRTIIIHESGVGAERLRVDSVNNGWGYAIHFGEAGAPMRDLWFQDEDATCLRAEYDAMEHARPDDLSRDLWISVLDPYL